MTRNRTAALVLLLLSSIVLATGCAGTREVGAPATSVSELPGWVRIVVPERDGRSQFVGGTSFATDTEAGIEAADIDARTQIHQQATRHFTDNFNHCVQRSGVETTPMERLDIKNRISSSYGNRMTELARLDDSFHRPCGDEGEPADASSGNAPVCQVFVLMSVGADEWDTVLGELLAAEKRRRMEEGESHIAQFLEWMMREALEEQPEQGRERDR